MIFYYCAEIELDAFKIHPYNIDILIENIIKNIPPEKRMIVELNRNINWEEVLEKGAWIANELLASACDCVGVAIVMGKIRKILPRILFFFSALSEINDQRKYSESSSYLDCECKCCFQRRMN